MNDQNTSSSKIEKKILGKRKSTNFRNKYDNYIFFSLFFFSIKIDSSTLNSQHVLKMYFHVLAYNWKSNGILKFEKYLSFRNKFKIQLKYIVYLIINHILAFYLNLLQLSMQKLALNLAFASLSQCEKYSQNFLVLIDILILIIYLA